MTCREAEELIESFVQHTLTPEEKRGFLEHVRSCQECREELEICYMVYVGLTGLDNDTLDTYDLLGALNQELERTQLQVQYHERNLLRRYVMTTLAVVGIILCIGIQLSLWL